MKLAWSIGGTLASAAIVALVTVTYNLVTDVTQLKQYATLLIDEEGNVKPSPLIKQKFLEYQLSETGLLNEMENRITRLEEQCRKH